MTEPVITFNSINPVIKVEISTLTKRKQSQFSIDYTAYPTADFYLYNPLNELIASGTDVLDRKKYGVTLSAYSYKFKISYPDLNDYGNYTLIASTLGKNFSTSVKLIIFGKMKENFAQARFANVPTILFQLDKPTVSMEDVYVQAGEEVQMICRVIAHPKAEITWSFQPCQDLSLWPSCRKDRNVPTYNVEPYVSFILIASMKILHGKLTQTFWQIENERKITNGC